MTIENVHTAIGMLESIDPTDEYAYEKAFLAYKTIKKLPVFINSIEYPIEVFRARTSFDNIFYENVNDISLPPHGVITSYARCNKPFQSKFYCAENRPTSYIELTEYWATSREVGEKLYVTIGRWSIKRPFTTIIVTSPYPDQRRSTFDIYHGQAFDQILNQYDGEFKEANIMLYDYLFKKFRKSAKNDRHTYLVTSTYCNIAMCGPENFDAIYYPSVPFGETGVNFAFNSQFIKKDNIEILGVLRDEFEVYINDEGKKSFLQTNSLEAERVVSDSDLIIW